METGISEEEVITIEQQCVAVHNATTTFRQDTGGERGVRPGVMLGAQLASMIATFGDKTLTPQTTGQIKNYCWTNI